MRKETANLLLEKMELSSFYRENALILPSPLSSPIEHRALRDRRYSGQSPSGSRRAARGCKRSGDAAVLRPRVRTAWRGGRKPPGGRKTPPPLGPDSTGRQEIQGGRPSSCSTMIAARRGTAHAREGSGAGAGAPRIHGVRCGSEPATRLKTPPRSHTEVQKGWFGSTAFLKPPIR